MVARVDVGAAYLTAQREPKKESGTSTHRLSYWPSSPSWVPPPKASRISPNCAPSWDPVLQHMSPWDRFIFWPSYFLLVHVRRRAVLFISVPVSRLLLGGRVEVCVQDTPRPHPQCLLDHISMPCSHLPRLWKSSLLQISWQLRHW